LNPKFDEKELDLLKSQTLDGLTYNLRQPSSLASYVASKYSFGEHPAGGTPISIASITRADVENFYDEQFRSNSAILIFSGNISAAVANGLAAKNLGSMKRMSAGGVGSGMGSGDNLRTRPKTVGRMLVIDMPKSGQASVGYFKRANDLSRRSDKYFPAIVYNTVLGGGYSSRLNMEIRIKRGLSYGAGSGFGWRLGTANFSTRAQTKNESAPEVAELVVAEIDKMADTAISKDELVPRKSVLTGGFGRNLETTGGLANALAELYSFGIPATQLNKYIPNVNAVTAEQIKELAGYDPLGGDIIIVGDYSVFKDDLAKRFPNMKVDVIKAADLDLSKDNLRK
jgi:zinc protease